MGWDEETRATPDLIQGLCRSYVRVPSHDYPGWVKARDGVPGTSPEVVSLDAVVAQIDHICQVAGDARHAAVGSDLDGGYGTEQCPHDLDTIADLASFFAILEQRGYSHADLEGIAHGNFLSLLRRAWA